MSVYDRLEEAKHDPVLVCGMIAGVSTYCCERCGALIKIRSGVPDGEVILFFVPETSFSTESRCLPIAGIGREGADRRVRQNVGLDATKHIPLRDRLKRLEEDDWERVRRTTED